MSLEIEMLERLTDRIVQEAECRAHAQRDVAERDVKIVELARINRNLHAAELDREMLMKQAQETGKHIGRLCDSLRCLWEVADAYLKVQPGRSARAIELALTLRRHIEDAEMLHHSITPF